jgi:hypothetical protein
MGNLESRIGISGGNSEENFVYPDTHHLLDLILPKENHISFHLERRTHEI